MKKMTLSDYAKHRKVSRQAVSKAVKEGRIKTVLDTKNNRFVMVEEADAQWDANTYPKPVSRAAQASLDAINEDLESITRIPESEEAEVSYNDARTKKDVIQTKLLQLKYDELSGKLVDAREVEQKWTEIATKIKTKVLGLASKLKQRRPHLSVEDFETLDALAREALEELANESFDEAGGSPKAGD